MPGRSRCGRCAHHWNGVWDFGTKVLQPKVSRSDGAAAGRKGARGATARVIQRGKSTFSSLGDACTHARTPWLRSAQRKRSRSARAQLAPRSVCSMSIVASTSSGSSPGIPTCGFVG